MSSPQASPRRGSKTTHRLPVSAEDLFAAAAEYNEFISGGPDFVYRAGDVVFYKDDELQLVHSATVLRASSIEDTGRRHWYISIGYFNPNEVGAGLDPVEFVPGKSQFDCVLAEQRVSGDLLALNPKCARSRDPISPRSG